MSGTRIETTQSESTQQGVKRTLLQDARIDAAHPLNEQVPESVLAADLDLEVEEHLESPSVTETGESPIDDPASEQLWRQADQLAEYLRNRQKDLDHRESMLNAAMASLESDVRNARMWFSEHEAEHAERNCELDIREKELLERLDRLAAAEAVFQRQTASKADQNAMQCARQEIDARQEVLLQQMRQREAQLEKAENSLAQAQAETRDLHDELIAKRGELREEISSERQRLIAWQRETMCELEKKRDGLQRRCDEVDRCRAGLLRLRDELRQIHRETLEIRLATEELWLKLSGAAQPAALSHSLSRIHSRLAEEYRLANAELLKRKNELEEIRDQLVEQYKKLLDQKRQFECSTAAKQEQLHQQTSELAARGQELSHRQTHFEEQSGQWRIERTRYEQEIRRLQLKISEQCEQA